ncbi:MAG: hypothetical protein MUO27_09265 [Sedimentisphaerales bacterium]|nr:hypothetical protein [Sedimentisphaerales bacterium]
MKPKTQMRIGLWGIITLTLLGGFQLSLPSVLCLFIFVVYIFGIVRRKLTIARTAFRVYLILLGLSVVIIFIGVIISISIGGWPENPWLPSTCEILVILIVLIIIALHIFMMWMGLRGLERVLESESELNEKKTSVKEKNS